MRLRLLLEILGIDLKILNNAHLQDLIQAGDDVDAIRFIEKKSGIKFSKADTLLAINAIVTYPR